jgi:hypothetical protein
VFSGMLGVTFFGLFLTPVFFVSIEGPIQKRRAAGEGPAGGERPADELAAGAGSATGPGPGLTPAEEPPHA